MRRFGVDVWCLRLTEGHFDNGFADLLVPAEIARAAAFHSATHRQKFVVARAALRLILARHAETEPRAVQLEYGLCGKPYLGGSKDIRFNIAHSGEMAVYAISWQDVGIDVEQVRPISDVMAIARRFFCKAETHELESLHGTQQLIAFHRCWARKEAYIKAVGTGLSLPLESFQVSLLPGEPARIKASRDEPGQEAEWQLRDLHIPEGYAAALAVRAPEIDLWTSPPCDLEGLPAALLARDI